MIYFPNINRKINQNYLQYKMKALIILLALTFSAHSAIMSQQIFTLSRIFQYRIQISSKNGTFVEYATISPTINGCLKGRCFYGWINNYTLQNKEVQGLNDLLVSKNSAFFVQLLQGSSLQLTSNNQLQTKAKMAINITALLLTPLPFGYSNLGQENRDQIYYFTSLDNRTDDQMIAASLNPSLYNFSDIAETLKSNSAFVGWSLSNPESDVMLYDKGLNSFMARELILSNEITVKIELVNKSLFGDLSTYIQIISQLATIEDNKNQMLITQSLIFPQSTITSLFY